MLAFTSSSAQEQAQGQAQTKAETQTQEQGSAWRGRLGDGSQVVVDPTTRRPVVSSRKGYQQQLWDGVHHLENGSTVIVRSGRAVPTTSMVEQWRRHAPSPEPRLEIEGLSPCGQLMRRVCGLHDECFDRDTCARARALISHYSARLMQAPRGASDAACVQALQDQTNFPACDRPQKGRTLSPCETLLEQSCQRGRQCADPGLCAEAKKYLAQEYRERRLALDPDAITPTGRQCGMIMGNPARAGVCDK
jgi:hypothetical protein